MPSLLVLTGPPGVGKTTVARLVADSLPSSAHLHADDFWRFIRGGWIEPWLPEAQQQNEVVMDAVAATAGRLVAGGFDVVVDGVVGPWFLQQFRRGAGAAGDAMHYVVLAAPLEVTLARTKVRAGDGLADETAIRIMHEQFPALDAGGVCTIDATRGPDVVAADVLAMWRAGAARVT